METSLPDDAVDDECHELDPPAGADALRESDERFCSASDDAPIGMAPTAPDALRHKVRDVLEAGR